MIGFFIFHRDLRLHDNIGLQRACAECTVVYCFFIFDARQVIARQNPYFSENSFSFMIDCLAELSRKIPHMHFIYEPRLTPAKALRVILRKVIANDAQDFPQDYTRDSAQDYTRNYAIYSNADYTPFAIARDKEFHDEFNVRKTGPPRDVYRVVIGDLGLNSPLDIKPYKVFTPYARVAMEHAPAKPFKLTNAHRQKIKKLHDVAHKIPNEILSISSKNKRRDVILHFVDLVQIVKRVSSWSSNEYGKRRDDLNFSGSRLSPYMKYGVISARQAYYLTHDKTFRKQLYWRDFYTQITYHFPNTTADYNVKKSGLNARDTQSATQNAYTPIFEANFKETTSKNFREPKNANKLWRKAGQEEEKLFALWSAGRTCVPIVDACMRQLNTTGFMHNRGRLIVSSFLTKILHIDWRRGEQYFASKLTDYDPALNNGNWQWSAGTGADAQPFFRIFNPYTQGKNHDPQATYIKQYVPELASLDARAIHNIRSEIIDYEKERAVALKLYGI